MVSKLSEVHSGTEKCSGKNTSSFRYFILVEGSYEQVGTPFDADRDCGHWSMDQIRSAEQVREGSWILSAAAKLLSDDYVEPFPQVFGGEYHQDGGVSHH